LKILLIEYEKNFLTLLRLNLATKLYVNIYRYFVYIDKFIYLLQVELYEMRNFVKFNKFYTFISGAASVSTLYQLLSLYPKLSWQISGLFLILIFSFLLGFFYSLGFIGGKKGNYGFTKDINFKAIVTLFLAFLIEIDVWLYFFAGIDASIFLAYIQIFVVIIVAATKLRHKRKSIVY